MSDWKGGEKISIKESNKSFKRYGSTSQHTKREHYITHNVEKTDTLQGLALKYNTTTEQIRRANRLFASDSLFLRDVLKIPVPHAVAEQWETTNNHSCTSPESSTINSSFSLESCSDDDKSASEFLGKIDSAIATTRAQVKHVQKNSHFVDPNDPTMAKRKQNKRPIPASLQPNSTEGSEVLQPAILNHDRQVRNSLQRLQCEQDNLFEL